MKKIYYLSTECFAQVDLGIIHLLSQKYDVVYGLMIHGDDVNFSEKELNEYCAKHAIRYELFTFKYRKRDIRIGLEFLDVLKSVRKFKPDIIYTVSHEIPILSLMCFPFRKKNTIVAMHDVISHSDTQFQLFIDISKKITFAHFKYFHVFSDNQEQIFTKMFPRKKVYNIPLNLTDFDGVNLVKNPVVKNNNKIKFLFFGNILYYKGLDILIRAVNNLSKKYQNFELVIAGRCADWDAVYEPIIDSKVNVKKIIRIIDNAEIPALFLSSHYLILPYRDATQSGPLMIAYNYNVPVIASDIPAFRESVEEGASGFLFDLENLQALETVLEAALMRDDETYNIIKYKLNKYVNSKFSSESIKARYQLMFSEVMGKV